MAKASIVARQQKKLEAVQKYHAKRLALKRSIQQATTLKERMELQAALQKLPRNASPTRYKTRCQQCKRSRAVYRRFGLCRICLRQHLMNGDVPGGKKGSW